MTDTKTIYLDNAATTFPKPEAVYQSMDSFYRQYGGNAGRGSNPLARKAAALVDETRNLTANWLQTPNVIFSPSATISLNMAIMGANLRAGDVVYTTPFEHNSVLRPLEHLRKTVGIEVKVLPFNKMTFECDIDAIGKLFRLDPPSMICVTQASNVTGYMPPVGQILTLAKDVNPHSVTIVDGAQVAGLQLLDMTVVDALVFSGHKSFYGPYGIAGIGFGTNWRPEPILRGGTGTISESLEMPVEGVSRFESGSHNISAFAGLNASLKWLNETGRAAINSHIHEHTQILCDELSDLSDILLYLPKQRERHHGIVSFTIKDIMPQAIENALGAQKIAVRAGLHCAPWIHEFMSTQSAGGTVRVSVGYFNVQDEMYSLKRVSQQLIHI